MMSEIIDADFTVVEPDKSLIPSDGHKNLKDGVYIGLDEELYFAEVRMGSSDWSKLSSDSPEDWFYGSKHNPDVEDYEITEDLLFGRGLHGYLLEGDAEFERKFARLPFKDYVCKEGRAWKADIIANGQTPLKSATWKNVIHMGELVRNHPDLGPFFKGGLSEVTVLYTYDGIPMRARFDKLLMDFIVDLKTLGKHKTAMVSNDYLMQKGLTRDEFTCLKIIKEMRYSLQRSQYSHARHFLRDFVKQGKVYGASPQQMKWLNKLADVETWGFLFVFYRKVNHKAKSPAAPIVTPIKRDMGDFTDERGFAMFERGIANYKRLVGQFGLNIGWARVNPASNPDDTVLFELFGADIQTDKDEPETEDEDDEDDIF